MLMYALWHGLHLKIHFRCMCVVWKFRAVLWYPFCATRAHLFQSIHPSCWLCRTYLSMIQQCLIASIQLAASSRLIPHSSIGFRPTLYRGTITTLEGLIVMVIEYISPCHYPYSTPNQEVWLSIFAISLMY